MNSVKIFKQSIKIGGFSLPADFKYIGGDFLGELFDLEFKERICKIFYRLTGKELTDDAFNNLNDVGYPSSLFSLDENLCVAELFDGENCAYTDYIFDNSDIFCKISSVISLLCSIYCDAVSSGFVSIGERVNFALSDADYLLVISAIIANKIGVPIDGVIAADKELNGYINGGYFVEYDDGEISDFISDFFYEYDYPLDSFSASSIIAQNEYFLSETNQTFTIVLALFSIYLDSRKTYNAIADKKEISIDKAINELYLETAVEIPENIVNKKVKPFVNLTQNLSRNDFIYLIENIVNKV